MHRLAYEGHSIREHNFIDKNVFLWFRKFTSSTRPAVGLYGVKPLTKLFRDYKIPTVNLQHYSLTDLINHPIANVNVMAPGNYQNWGDKHWHGQRGVWHDCCARLMACRMSGWVRISLKVNPTVAEVNAPRVLWQRWCDELLDMILCDCCIEEKEGKV